MKKNIIIIVITALITILAVLGVQFLLQQTEETKLNANQEQVNNVETQEDEKNNVESEYVENIVEEVVENTQNNNEIVSENINVSENTDVSENIIQTEEQENDDKEQISENLSDKNQVVVEEQSGNMGMMGDYQIVGMLKIPDIHLEYPVLENVTKYSLELSPAVAYGELNEASNTVIYGNAGSHFKNLTQLDIGDTIYAKDSTNREIAYEILEKKYVNANDASYFTTKIEGKKAISLQTGGTSIENRFVIIAAEKK